MPWDSGMEGRVKNSHLNGGREVALAGLDARKVGGVVKRRQSAVFRYDRFDWIVDHRGAGERLPAVYHAVSDSDNLLNAADHSVGRVREGDEDGAYGLIRIGDGKLLVQGLPLPAAILQPGAVRADALDDAGSLNRFSISLEKF